MGMDGFKYFQNNLTDQRGQTAVEYILLVAVIAGLVFTVLKSDEFKAIFGKEGKFGTVFRSEVEYSYRHARGGRGFYSAPDYSNSHDSYSGRFFSAKDAYPQ